LLAAIYWYLLNVIILRLLCGSLKSDYWQVTLGLELLQAWLLLDVLLRGWWRIYIQWLFWLLVKCNLSTAHLRITAYRAITNYRVLSLYYLIYISGPILAAGLNRASRDYLRGWYARLKAQILMCLLLLNWVQHRDMLLGSWIFNHTISYLWRWWLVLCVWIATIYLLAVEWALCLSMI